jgi:ribosomal protein S18 acetylase RimI-like enzyme
MPITSPFTIRRAVPEDARAIAEIGVAGWQAAYTGILPADFLAGLRVGPREAAWRARLESDDDDGAPAWVAEDGSRRIGFVAAGPPRDENLAGMGTAAAEIYAIYVLPGEWRRGSGSALLQIAEDELRRRGASTLVLWVLEDNGAGRAFYEAMGWLPDGGRQTLDLGGFEVQEIRYRRRL